MLKILLASDELRSSTQHVRSCAKSEFPVHSFFHIPSISLNFPSWDGAGNELMQKTKVEGNAWKSGELSSGHHILSQLFQYFTGGHDYCRIALLKNICSSSIGIFKFWITYSKKVCLTYRKEEIHTFVASKYWYRRNVQSSGTTFVSALHFAEKFRDNNFKGKFCDFTICLWSLLGVSTECQKWAEVEEKAGLKWDWNHSPCFGKVFHSRSWCGSCGTPSPCAPPRSASPLWYPHMQQDLLWKASNGHISPETEGNPDIVVFIWRYIYIKIRIYRKKHMQQDAEPQV